MMQSARGDDADDDDDDNDAVLRIGCRGSLALLSATLGWSSRCSSLMRFIDVLVPIRREDLVHVGTYLCMSKGLQRAASNHTAALLHPLYK